MADESAGSCSASVCQRLAVENARLKARIEELEDQMAAYYPEQKTDDSIHGSKGSEPFSAIPPLQPLTSLTNPQIARYSRQLLVPYFGTQSQIKFSSTTVLIVGAGGLGAPAILYLAGAGVGRLIIVDHDVVEVSNIHRQVIHAEQSEGLPKVLSARAAALRVNSSVEIVAVQERFSAENALQLVQSADIVMDATDNIATRYLINDTCVIAGKPLVSGAAQGVEGQLTVYNYEGGPCYRCLYPRPPPATTVVSCSDGGVLGMLPGTIGCLQALEVLKVAAGIGTTFAKRLLILDGLDGRLRVVKLRPRSALCAVCGDEPSITTVEQSQEVCTCAGIATEEVVAPSPDGGALHSDHRVTCQEYAAVLQSGAPHVLVDVREPVQYGICHLPHSINIPLSKLPARRPEILALARGASNTPGATPSAATNKDVYFICRRGVFSQAAASLELESGEITATGARVLHIDGGLAEWHRAVDSNFPFY